VNNQVQVPPNDPNVENLIKEKEKEISKELTKKDDQFVIDNQAKSFVRKAPFLNVFKPIRRKIIMRQCLKVLKNIQIIILFLDAIN